MTVRELRRTPTVHRLADELFCADEESEADKDDDGVLTTEPVHVVIVHTELHLPYTQHGLEQTIHVYESLCSDNGSSSRKYRAIQNKLGNRKYTGRHIACVQA